MELYILIAIGIIILVLLFVYLSKKTTERKTKTLQELAVRMCGTYYPDAPEAFTNRLDSFNLFTKPCEYRSFSHLILAMENAVEKAVFEFHLTVAPAPRLGGLFTDADDRTRSNESYDYTVLYLQSDKLNLPQFVLTKHGFWDGISTAFGLQKDIDFESHKNFSISYNLRGADETTVRNFFNPQILGYFENNQTFSAEGHGHEMIIYCDKLMDEDIQPFVDKSSEAFKLFQHNPGSA